MKAENVFFRDFNLRNGNESNILNEVFSAIHRINRTNPQGPVLGVIPLAARKPLYFSRGDNSSAKPTGIRVVASTKEHLELVDLGIFSSAFLHSEIGEVDPDAASTKWISPRRSRAPESFSIARLNSKIANLKRKGKPFDILEQRKTNPSFPKAAARGPFLSAKKDGRNLMVFIVCSVSTREVAEINSYGLLKKGSFPFGYDKNSQSDW